MGADGRVAFVHPLHIIMSCTRRRRLQGDALRGGFLGSAHPIHLVMPTGTESAPVRLRGRLRHGATDVPDAMRISHQPWRKDCSRQGQFRDQFEGTLKMANNYYDMTGVLVLDTVTPVIKALFGPFDLDENHPGNGEVYIADIAESTDASWDTVLANLLDLIEQIGLPLPDVDDDSIVECLYVLAPHFSAEQNEELANLIAQSDFENGADLDSLFTIARAFDDGHGLKAYKAECSWHCSKPRLFEFGGAGNFGGRHIAVGVSSQQAVELGEKLEAALELGDTDEAAAIIREKVGSILAGIHSEVARNAIRSKLSDLLADPEVAAVPTAARIVIGLDGGIIQGVTSNIPLAYLVYDYDVEGCDEDEVATRPALDGGEVDVFAAVFYNAAIDVEKVVEIFDAVTADYDPAASCTCSDCGTQTDSIIGAPDGAEICQACFDAGQH